MIVRLIRGVFVLERKNSGHYYCTINSTNNGFGEVFPEERLKVKYPSTRWVLFRTTEQMG